MDKRTVHRDMHFRLNEPCGDALIHHMAHGFLKNAVPAPTFPCFDPGRAILKAVDPRPPGKAWIAEKSKTRSIWRRM
ncbi:hypothetical protein [Hydrogenibacillus schlegelii]|uniref:hypothetical protein n=1 Tax=Hydrogenibacillus schlegelii TaxID=1484 RepID=UPI0034A02410